MRTLDQIYYDIDNHWYEDTDNFPALLARDTELDQLSFKAIPDYDSFVKAHRQGWRLATKDGRRKARWLKYNNK